MKKYIYLFLLSSAISFQSFASHVVGADMSYTCTSTPGIWHIKLAFYRDCQGISVCPDSCGGPCQKSIRYEGSDPSCDGYSFGSANLSLTSVSDVNPNPQCPNAKSICNNMTCVTPGTYTPGIERYIFEGDINLGPTSGIPASCCNIRIIFEEQARNGAISTGSAGQNFYIETIINRCLSLSPCNSSPELSNDPFAILCGGQPYVFNNGAIDPDHDSLTYAFTPALQGHNSSVSYNAPWSYDYPMPAYPPKTAPFPLGMHCDPLTGDIMFTPNFGAGGPFVGVMVIEIKQWKTINGVPTNIGTTRRDIQMWLFTCPINSPPRIMTNPSIGNQPKLSWTVRAGNSICFDVIGLDSDFYPSNSPPVSDTTYLSWNGALASKGATLLPKYNIAQRKTLGPREDIYQFCWTPDSIMVSTIPWYFILTAKDSRCPNPGKATRAISILVTDIPTGVDELLNSENIKIYPNPTTGLLTIEFETFEKNIALEVFDVLGRSALKTTSQHRGGLFQKSFDLSHLKQGIYFVKIVTGSKRTTMKVTLE